MKTYTEKEIIEMIERWRNIEVEGAWSSKKTNYDSHECNGQDGSDISFTKKDFELLIKELKQKFMTTEGFRKAIKESGMIGEEFTFEGKKYKVENHKAIEIKEGSDIDNIEASEDKK